MNGQFSLRTIDKIFHKIGVLNVLLNRILIMLIPQSEANAEEPCYVTSNYYGGGLCEPYTWACDTSTRCLIWEKHYTYYYQPGNPNPCPICDWWVDTRQPCSPCLD
ncbi:MAG: hypothetical protein CVU41_11795 [Chloroflexi bacterium HGW-Chloroflexi-3]|nr:MAG: hypothetical protein CVU41_11795 [Chloroflexi bacterium HGW-Chloroflexi-3]